MAKFDSHLKRIEKRLRTQESKRISGNIAEALREHATSGKLPDHPGLREEVLRVQQCTLAMMETLPKTTKSK